MKLIPTIDKEFLAMVSMIFVKKTKSFLLLIDKEKQVIEAEEEIWSLLKLKGKSKRTGINLSSISEKIVMIVDILEELQNISDKNSLFSFNQDSILGPILNNMKKIINLNKLEKVYLDPDRNSSYSKELLGTRIYLKIEPMNFKEIEMTKLYMTFQRRGEKGFKPILL